MKIIFLDIDGVLNLLRRERDEYGQLFHEEWVENLRKIIDATGAKIVITSTWRGSGLKHMQDMWKHRNLPGEVIDTTPFLINSIVKYIDREFEPEEAPDPRGIEIDWWLGKHGFNRAPWDKDSDIEYLRSSPITNFIILDDDVDMLLCQKEHFIRTSNRRDEEDAIEGFGITNKVREEAIRILNTDIVDLYYA